MLGSFGVHRMLKSFLETVRFQRKVIPKDSGYGQGLTYAALAVAVSIIVTTVFKLLVMLVAIMMILMIILLLLMVMILRMMITMATIKLLFF